jgi:hypothetical protein
MKKIVFIEGASLLLLSLIGVAEGVRLIIQKDPQRIQEALGPGFYVLFASLALMIVGVAHLLVNYRSPPSVKKAAVGSKSEGRATMIGMIIVLVLYLFLIQAVGYLLASIVFFFMEFRMVGIKSWRKDITLTLIFTAVYYVVFIKYCDMSFPQAYLFR